MNKKALIAMSGGVDSSVAAYLLKEQGYDLAGAMMKLYESTDPAFQSGCCSMYGNNVSRHPPPEK